MHIRNLTTCGFFAAILSVCAWFSFPVGSWVFTLQSFGICLALLVLGGKWGTVSILVYLALGFMGLPVFSGFRGGLWVLAGPTGGYLVGFILWGIVYWVVTAVGGSRLLGTFLGLLSCYAGCCGWVCLVYGNMGLWAALGFYVVPYFLPDLVKILGAWFFSRRLGRFSY